MGVHHNPRTGELSSPSTFIMTFWQENYHFIKDVYDMRHTKMAEGMENVEKVIARIMADKVYTSAEFKRERDNFHALCKDLERAEAKKWLAQILEILMAERAKDQKAKEGALLDALIKKHEELIPTVMKTQRSEGQGGRVAGRPDQEARRADPNCDEDP